MADRSDLTWGVVLPHGAAGEFVDADPRAAWSRLRNSAVTCDRLGYDHVWISDHLMASAGDRTGPQFEAYSTLAALTQVTERTRLGVIVTCAQYRSVAMLAKQAAGIDVMSDGRLIFALGGGWDEGEFRAFGYPFPSPAERVSFFGETLEAVLGLWSQPKVDFAGRQVRLAGATCNPRPVDRPPIWTGTHGPRGLRVAARFADVANWNVGLADFRRLTAELASACADVGRDPATIETSVFRLADLSGSDRNLRRILEREGESPDLADTVGADHFIGSVDTVISRVQDFVDSGARHLVMLFLDAEETDASAERFYREVVPAIRPRGASPIASTPGRGR
jgi:alkanesulfonate monooxygenase SsuD/methylene tetrahydromethanopterin reductase-like flavin-dependent oxidoreductase (luciferase family)